MNNRGLSLEERAREMHLLLWKDRMNKTSVATQAQYFTFIGQIPRNSHEYHLCNTPWSMGRRGSSGRPRRIPSTVRLEAKVGCKGHEWLLAHWKTHLWGEGGWRGVGGKVEGGKQGVQWLASTPAACLSSRGPGGQEPRKQPCLHNSAQFQPSINHTGKIDEEFFFNNQACLGKWPPDLCLISSPNADRDPYCQLSLAQLGLAAP